MTAFIIVSVIVLLLTFLLLQWISATVRYTDEPELTVRVSAFPIKLKKSKKKKPEKKKSKKKEPEKSENAPAPSEAKKKKKESDLSALFDVIDVVKELLPRFAGKLHLRTSRLHITVGGEDAASVALTCGAAKAGASLLFEFIDRWCILDGDTADSVSVEPDFTSGECDFDIELTFRIRVFDILLIGVSFLVKFIKKKTEEEKAKIEKG